EPEVTAYTAQILDPDKPDDGLALQRLRTDPSVEVLDRLDAQLANLRGLRPTPDSTLLGEGTRWAYYPWRRAIVAGLGPRGAPAGTARYGWTATAITSPHPSRTGSARCASGSPASASAMPSRTPWPPRDCVARFAWRTSITLSCRT